MNHKNLNSQYNVFLNRRDYLFIIAVGACFICVCLMVMNTVRNEHIVLQEKAVKKVLPEPVKIAQPKKILPHKMRDIDIKKLKKALETGALSSKEALFYHKTENGK